MFQWVLKVQVSERKYVFLYPRALPAPHGGSKLKSYLFNANKCMYFRCVTKKNMLGKSKQEITLTHRKEKGKVLAKNL